MKGERNDDVASGRIAAVYEPAGQPWSGVAGEIETKLLDTCTAPTYTPVVHRREIRMTHNLIQSDPDVMTGKPVVRGTRITVETILRKLSCGESIEQILESHPRLTRESVLAALEYAAEAMAHETVHAVAEPDSA